MVECRVKKSLTYYSHGKWSIYICPQEKWHCVIHDDKVEITHKGFSMIISREEFDEHWKIKEQTNEECE